MLAVQKLDMLVKLCLASAYVKGEKPLSMMLISDTAAGKTIILRQYRNAKGIIYTANISFAALLVNHGAAIQRGELRHLLWQDFAIQTGKSRDQAGAELAAFAALIEEGIMNWETMRVRMPVVTVPATLGVLLTTTRGSLDKLKEVAPPGFLSRFLRVSYSYTETDKAAILESITRRDYLAEDAAAPAFSFGEPRAIAGDAALFRRFVTSGIVDRVKEPGDTYGFRTLKNLQSLAMANALLEGRDHIIFEDLELVARLSAYFNEEYRKL